MGDLVPREKLVKQGMTGVGAIGGGATILILKAISAIPLVGVIAGGAVALAGLAIGSKKEDRKAGMVAVTAGVLTGLSALFPSVSWLMLIAGLGLIGGGALKLFKFWQNLRRRM